jgi:hypothetical protein
MRIVLSQDFHYASAVVAMLDQGDQLHSVDHEAIMEGRNGEERTMRAVRDNGPYQVLGFEAWGG